jgi:acyl-CoA dehydrogenase
LDFTTPQHWEPIRDALGALSREYGPEYWRAKDAEHAFPAELWRALGDNGWLGVTIPEEHGGQGMSFLDAVFVVETACRGGGGSTLSQLFMATPVFGGETIRRHGSDALKKRQWDRQLLHGADRARRRQRHVRHHDARGAQR